MPRRVQQIDLRIGQSTNGWMDGWMDVLHRARKAKHRSQMDLKNSRNPNCRARKSRRGTHMEGVIAMSHIPQHITCVPWYSNVSAVEVMLMPRCFSSSILLHTIPQNTAGVVRESLCVH
jgi:hypothetical protein